MLECSYKKKGSPSPLPKTNFGPPCWNNNSTTKTPQWVSSEHQILKKNLISFCTAFVHFISLILLTLWAQTSGSRRGTSAPPPAALSVSCSSLYNFTVWPGQKPPGHIPYHSWANCWAPERLTVWLNKNFYSYTCRAWLQFHSNLIVEFNEDTSLLPTPSLGLCSCLCTIPYIMPAQMFVQMGREWGHGIDPVGKK